MSINCVHMLLDLLFKHITNVSVLLLGEIRCVKNVSNSQFQIPPCEQNATSFGFICFIYSCKSAPGCIFIKHRLHDQNNSIH